MKKKYLILIVLSILLLTGCTKIKKGERNIYILMDEYVKAYTEADLEMVKDVFPPYYVEYAKKYMTQEFLDNSLKEAKEKYGDDFNIVYEITSEDKFAENDIAALNAKVKELYNSDDKATECYTYEGKIIFKGSKKESNETLKSMKRCKYDGKWYLVRY